MFRILIILLLAVVSGNVAAEWIRYSESESQTSYVDSRPPHRDGDKAKIWSLFVFKKVQFTNGRPYISQKSQAEFDCKNEQWRINYYSYHTGDMASGELVISSADPTKWAPIPPDSGMIEGLWKLVCSNP
jgi:hypothetical protein